MDWIRRNWPDLLIGVALIAVIAGILATLLRGDTLWGGNTRAGRTDPPPLTQAQPVREPLLANPEVTGLRSEVLPTGVTIQPIIPNLPSIDAPQTAGDPLAPSNQALTVETSTLGATGAAPATTGATTEGTVASDGLNPLGVSIQPANTTITPVTPGSPAATTPTSTPASGTALGGTALSGGTYVSVGAFRNIENAQRQAAVFRSEGFSSTVAQQGNFFYAVVGPYSNRADADRVISQVRASGRDAGVFSGSAVAPAASPATQPASQPVSQPVTSGSGSVTITPIDNPAVTTQPVPSPAAGTRFLQVGAYGSSQSAAPQRQRLQGLGYSVFERSESGLVKLVVGPFNDGDINRIRSTLAAQGIDSFPVR